MKNINYLNYFAVGLPLIILASYPIFKEGALFFSLLSTMLTGLIQVILGIKMFADDTKNKFLSIYIFLVLLFFGLCTLNSIIGFNYIINFIIFSLPPLLAIYLSVIIYKKAKNENLN